MDFDKKAIGERIKEYRLKRGFTQSDLAKQADITRIALGNYERGSVYRLLIYLHVLPWLLMHLLMN